jgi:hypothetical protein
MLSMHLTGAMSAGGPRGALPLSPELQQCAIGEGRLLLRSICGSFHRNQREHDHGQAMRCRF